MKVNKCGCLDLELVLENMSLETYKAREVVFQQEDYNQKYVCACVCMYVRACVCMCVFAHSTCVCVQVVLSHIN